MAWTGHTDDGVLVCVDAVGAKVAPIIALVALAEYPDLAAAADELVRVRDRSAPDPARRGSYDDRQHEFLELRKTTTPTWHRAVPDRSAAGAPAHV
jgi:sugar (pentulose or hexulose) kinase